MDPGTEIEATSSTPNSQNHNLQRTSSITSSTSTTSSCRDNTQPGRQKRLSRQVSIQKPPTSAPLEDESLTSFPSLSPQDDSPSRNKRNRSSAQASLAKIVADANKTPSAKKSELKGKRSMVAALTVKSGSAQGRQALFDDSPRSATQDVPGSLHYASDAHVERLIARTGAIKLVRQLAEDLAQREAEMSSFRQRAEARERELKKMLREVEVGNMDIESRLHALNLEADKKADTDKQNSIGELMEEAIEEDITTGARSPKSRAKQDKQATIRAKAIREPDNASLVSQDTAASRGRGWKDYLWSATSTKKSSRTQSLASNEDQATVRRDGSGLRRKGIDEALFEPLKADTQSVNDKPRATSMSAWTMKLFAGTPASTREATMSSMNRARASTNANTRNNFANPSRTTSQTSIYSTDSSKIAQRQTDARSHRKPVPPLNFPNGLVKGPSASGSNVSVSSPLTEIPSSNLGPVEMDAILPHGQRPPTLTPAYHNIDNPDDLLTDRFGFIYDQRRRKKEAEALTRAQNANKQSRPRSLADSTDADSLNDAQSFGLESPGSEDAEVNPMSKWQDHLKKPFKMTELLSHTPSSTSIITLSNPAIRQSLRRTSTFESIKENELMSTPNPLPATLAVTASNAEIASPIIAAPQTPVTATKADFEPVKALLSQLTDLHDNLQREKSVKWNEFLRKIRVERRREEESSIAENKNRIVAMPEVSLSDGETIGIATLGNKGKVGRAKYREFKGLVLSGIPVALRAKVWAECSGALALRIPGYFSDLVSSGDDDPAIVAQIQMDINRTLTDNVFFRKGPGVEKLNEVLLAYSRRNIEVGYCQGMNLITASLLLIMPTAEDAFWLLVSIIENILPRHYYDHSLLTSRADQQVLKQYVSELLPKLANHLDNLSIDLEALTFQWFLSLFTACLNAEALYRVWDVLLCCKDEEGNGGSTFLFQVALALLKLNESQLIALESPGEVYAYLGGEITNHAISIDGLIKASEGLKMFVTRSEVEDRREKYVLREKELMKEREALGKNKKNGELEVQDPLPIED